MNKCEISGPVGEYLAGNSGTPAASVNLVGYELQQYLKDSH